MNLLELIEVNKRGRSLRDLANDSGGHIKDRGYFMASGAGRAQCIPNNDKLRGLAAALEVPLLTVILAAADQQGLLVFDPGEAPASEDTYLEAARARAARLQEELDAERGKSKALNLTLSGLRRQNEKLSSDSAQAKAQAKESAASDRAQVKEPADKGKDQPPTPPALEPLDPGSEAEYWREHAIRYRQRLARCEGLRPMMRRWEYAQK